MSTIRQSFEVYWSPEYLGTKPQALLTNVWLSGEYHVIWGCYSAGSGENRVIIKWFGLWIIHESFTKSYVIQCCNKLKSQGNHMWITCDFLRNQCVIHMWLGLFFLLGPYIRGTAGLPKTASMFLFFLILFPYLVKSAIYRIFQ